VTSLRMSGAVSPIPTHAFKAWTR